MKQQLLLLEDVDALGKKGEVVSAKPGYIRNYLLPKGYAAIATPNVLRKQERLRAEREKQAIVDRQESDALAAQVNGLVLEVRVKVDPDGHMYGSVSANDIADLFQEKGISIEKRNVMVTRPIKETGSHDISLKLKEGVVAQCKLRIIAEGVSMEGAESVVAPIQTEEVNSEETSAE